MNEMNRILNSIDQKVFDIRHTEQRIEDTLELFYEFGQNKDAETVMELQNHYKELTGKYYPEEFNVGYLWVI